MENNKEQLIQIWLEVGKKNSWIKHSNDPPFTLNSFSECKSIEVLAEKFVHGNWCLGQAFYFKNLCFINQIDGGDEWLVIKDDLDFESCTMGAIIKDGEFETMTKRMLAASLEDCKRLDYMKSGEKLEWSDLWDAMKREPKVWQLTTKGMYYEMLEALPPQDMTGRAFLVGEPDHHNSEGFAVYACFKIVHKRYEARYLTQAEFSELRN